MDLVRFIEETLNGKLHFLFSDLCVYVGCFKKIEGDFWYSNDKYPLNHVSVVISVTPCLSISTKAKGFRKCEQRLFLSNVKAFLFVSLFKSAQDL